MKLDYIYHSGFAIEADGVTVIIDYYKDSSEEVFNKGIVHDYLLEKPGLLYVLCSHFIPTTSIAKFFHGKKLRPRHPLHILQRHPESTAAPQRKMPPISIRATPTKDEHIRIQAFGSTDVGISFLIDLQGRRLFHAGDLKQLALERGIYSAGNTQGRR